MKRAENAGASTPHLTCQRVTSPDAWHELQPHWNRLLGESTDATPWQSYEHLSSWWRHLSRGRQLRIYVVRSGDVPVLILPLQLTTATSSGVRLRWLEPIGMLDDINRPHLWIGRTDAQAYRCALEQVWADRSEWDGLRIDELQPHDAECAALRSYAQEHRLIFRQLPFHPCPFLDLSGSWDEYIAGRGTQMQKNLRAARRKLDAMGAVTLHTYAGPAEIDEGYSLMLQVQSRSWKQAQGIGLSQSEEYRLYYKELLSQSAAMGACRILVLFCAGLPVAATIAITAGGTYYSSQIVHDESYAAASPGTLLESMELNDLFTHRVYRSYDFLGAALSNKLRWTSTVRQTCRILVLKNSVKMRLLDTYWLRIKPLLKRWRNLRDGETAAAAMPGDTLPF